MLSLIPFPYRLIALGLVILAAGAFGFVKGLNWSRAEHEAFVARVEAEGRVAQERAARRTQEAQKHTQEVADAYAANIVATRDTYERRLRDLRTRLGRAEQAAAAAPKPHVSREPGSIPDSELRDRIATLEIEIAELELRLATAATQIEAWKDYGRRVIAWAEAN